MTDQTFASQLIHDIYAGGNPKKEWAPMSDSNIKPGYVVRQQNDEKLYLTKSTDKKATGVMGLKAGQEIDTVYTVDVQELYPYYPVGQDTDVHVVLEATSPIAPVVKGDLLAIGTEDGKVRLFAYTDSTDITDSGINFVGRCTDIDAGSLSDDHIIKMNLSV